MKQCSACKNCIYAYFCLQLKLFELFSLLQQFQYIFQSVYQLIFSYTFFLQFSQSKYSPTSHDLSHSHSQLLGFQINPLSHTPLSISSLNSHPHLSSFQRCSLLQTLPSSLHLHLHVSCQSMCLLSLVLDIRLNTLTFKFFATSGTHIFACGSLIFLQLPPHLLVLMLKGQNTGSLLLTLIICGHTLHS